MTVTTFSMDLPTRPKSSRFFLAASFTSAGEALAIASVDAPCKPFRRQVAGGLDALQADARQNCSCNRHRRFGIGKTEYFLVEISLFETFFFLMLQVATDFAIGQNKLRRQIADREFGLAGLSAWLARSSG